VIKHQYIGLSITCLSFELLSPPPPGAAGAEAAERRTAEPANADVHARL